MDTALIIVVSYNNLELTKRACEYLHKQTYPVRIVVWDNNSQDGTKEWLAEQDWLEAKLSPENVYWTPAINAAMEEFYGGERLIGYMNNDAAPLANTVARMAELLERPEVGLVGPCMERIGGPQDVTNCLSHDIIRAGGFVDANLANLPPKRVNYVMGAFAMLRKEVWDEVGPLDVDMPLGADDHDYAIRLKQLGYQIWVAQNAHCRHAGHASVETPGAKQTWEDLGGKSWDVFNNKWDGYFATEEEAIKCHWGGEYVDGWDVGTGWS